MWTKLTYDKVPETYDKKEFEPHYEVQKNVNRALKELYVKFTWSNIEAMQLCSPLRFRDVQQLI